MLSQRVVICEIVVREVHLHAAQAAHELWAEGVLSVDLPPPTPPPLG